MSDAIEIEINDDKIEIECDINNGIDNPHNNKPITRIEVSPNGENFVTYSKKDNSIFCWNVENVAKSKLECVERIKQLCVSDDMKLVIIDNYERHLGIYDMKNNRQSIKLDCYSEKIIRHDYCTFNSNNDLILHNYELQIILIYSTQTNNYKWNCKRIYNIPENFKFISLSKTDKLLLNLNNSIYEWNPITEMSIKIFDSNEEIRYTSYEVFRKNIRIFRNEKFIYIKIKNKIIIYSIELEIPIASLNINNGAQLCNFINHTGSIHLLLPLLNGSTIMKQCWDLCLNRLENKGKLSSKKYQTFSDSIQTTTKYAIGIFGVRIWKIEFKDILEILAKMNLTFENSDEIVEYWYFDYDFKISNEIHKTYLSNIHLINPSTKNILELFDEVMGSVYVKKNYDHERVHGLWYIKEIDFKKSKVEELNLTNDGIGELLGSRLLNDNNIIVLTTNGLFIYYFNENNESISINYYHYRKISYTSNAREQFVNYKNVFTKTTLPLPNYDSFKYCDIWVSYVKDNKEGLLKYGVELLTFAIKEHKVELIDYIYKKCINYFKEDLRGNREFLSIVTSTMPLLYEHYPEYISKYSSETTMIIDSYFYSIEHEYSNLHLHSFYNPAVINLTQSIWWLKFCLLIFKIKHNYIMIYLILKDMQNLIMLSILPIYFAIFYILSKHHFIHNYDILYVFYYNIADIFSKIFSNIFIYTTIPTITFMNPYIKFVSYPQEYNWFLELIIPQSSPFVKTISRDIYKTWEGETLINFKWNKYGKYYYAIIWIGFMILLGCFTAAATIPKQYIDDDTRKQLLIASIIFGFTYLSFEIRQFIYNPIKWVRDFWNIFDLIAFLLPIYTSIYWLQTNNKHTQLLSFSCLFLDIKFLLFFRVFESFGIYFAIIISVGKQIASFLVVLLIIIISFAHAFYILLVPESNFSFEEYTNNKDPNNPWNIASAYYQVFENRTVDSNSYMVQLPDENTNMFVDFGTAIFAMYLFLTGDSSALTNWTYKDNPSLVILIVLFSLLIVVYLMNLLIGLLNNAIEKDNDRISYLIQKAEILAEIELLYLLPHQRRWKTWFPEVIYYYASVDKTRQKIKEMINKEEWNTDEFSELKRNLLNELKI
ncbi:hypothetical protein RhiirA4_470359 [Rhizophagus irregularis]|uniref:Ion transport domain-containing protein n=1 Tax=Rhizophagus irregularis TaxID=588596 RepID=A0A2I1H1A6_9GLOM|nr:hypothetical protein RhiirA4_470359 [Rhizophagus irregularis]